MGKTLVFCTSYSDNEAIWALRYRIWVEAIRSGEIAHDHLLLVDDGSPRLPSWPDIHVTNRLDEMVAQKPLTLFRFERRLGRQACSVYPGWYRSFCLAARFAERNGFEKVVHIESDGFIITRRMQQYINELTNDWIAPSIQSHAMPESAIQVMAGSGFRSYVEFTRKPYSDFVGIEAENFLPFTRIETGFIGSRYGESMHHVPSDADFVTQTNPSMRGKSDYYWWLKPEIFPSRSDG
jgi:hypothetical protein